MGIVYDPVSRVWRKLETIISSSEIGLNITEPRVSPVGRFVLFTTGLNTVDSRSVFLSPIYIYGSSPNRVGEGPFL